MAWGDKSNHRTFLGALSALSATLMRPRRLFGTPPLVPRASGKKLAGFGSTGNVYNEPGVATVIKEKER